MYMYIFILYPLFPSRTTLRFSASLVLIHLTPCSCGSIISGHLSALVSMVAFSIDMRSLGRFSLFHNATVAASVNNASTSNPSVLGIDGYMNIYIYIYTCTCICRYQCVSGGEYR